MINICPLYLVETASISVSNCDTTRSITLPPSDDLPRDGTKASISSKKRMQGRDSMALPNTLRMFASDCPTNGFNNSGPLMLIKFILNSVAIALANNVLPVPGGPNSKIPMLCLTDLNNVEYANGNS